MAYNEERAAYLLQVAYDMLEELGGHAEVFYDGTNCDNLCLMDDIKALLEEWPNTDGS